tara:strand:+ start:254 stop:688 length:435 start_codon:yes stop_codon:yes gene_type:complete
MKLINKILLAVVLTGCTSTEINDNCKTSRYDQTGTYQMYTKEVSGNCGSLGNLKIDIDDGIVNINETFGCELSEDSWNSESCLTESVHYCDDGEWVMKLTWSVESLSKDSSKIIGNLSADMKRFSVAYFCSSKYKFEADKLEDI